MKREKTLTKRERKALNPGPKPPSRATEEQHIHCVACGRHLHGAEFDHPETATYVRCQHGSSWAACVACVPKARALLEEHDRTGQQVRVANAWH